ncbi:MAG: type II secretion system protein GspD [Candidatus Sumerlaeota bacterium]
MIQPIDYKTAPRNALTLMLLGLWVTLFASTPLFAQDGDPQLAEPPVPSAAQADRLEESQLEETLVENDDHQVRINARILEWTHNSTVDYGFAVRLRASANSDALVRNAQILLPSSEIQRVGQGMSGLFSGNETIGDLDFDAIIQLLEQEGSVKVRSEPNIVVNYPVETTARVSTSSRVPYEAVQAAGNTLVQVTRFKDTSIMLEVNIEDLVDDEYVRLRMRTSVTDQSGSVKVGKTAGDVSLEVPQTDQRIIENTVLAKDGKAFITGVLKTTADYETSLGVPWLSKLPVIGFLFRNQQYQERDSELLFIVRPEIIRN